jgi:hypothetical protein
VTYRSLVRGPLRGLLSSWSPSSGKRPKGDRPPSSSGLGHRPFTPAARVRIPLGVRNTNGPVVQLGVHAALSRRRSRVQISSGPLEGRSVRCEQLPPISLRSPLLCGRNGCPDGLRCVNSSHRSRSVHRSSAAATDVLADSTTLPSSGGGTYP